MNKRISALWEQLEATKSKETGFVKILFDPEMIVPIFFSLLFPEKLRAIFIKVDDFPQNIPTIFKGSAIKLDVYSTLENSDKYIFITLTDSSYSTVFDVFIDDCINTISTCRHISDSTLAFYNRFDKWVGIFDPSSNNGLSLIAQQGLFGELIILLRLLNKFPGRDLELLHAWQGPDKYQQDFHLNDWSIEVKSTINSNEIIISNENQLCTKDLSYLFLWHIILSCNNNKGLTLSKLIQEIKGILLRNPEAISLFEIRLSNYGYFDHQNFHYDELGYLITYETVYNVTSAFPGLNLTNIPVGISDLHYKLNLSFCTNYITSDVFLYNSLRI